MTATKQDIERWLIEGTRKGATHVIIACDTFDYDNYPVYVMPGEDARQKFDDTCFKNMTIVDECYNLSMDIKEQMSRYRCFEF